MSEISLILVLQNNPIEFECFVYPRKVNTKIVKLGEIPSNPRMEITKERTSNDRKGTTYLAKSKTLFTSAFEEQ